MSLPGTKNINALVWLREQFRQAHSHGLGHHDAMPCDASISMGWQTSQQSMTCTYYIYLSTRKEKEKEKKRKEKGNGKGKWKKE